MQNDLQLKCVLGRKADGTCGLRCRFLVFPLPLVFCSPRSRGMRHAGATLSKSACAVHGRWLRRQELGEKKKET